MAWTPSLQAGAALLLQPLHALLLLCGLLLGCAAGGLLGMGPLALLALLLTMAHAMPPAAALVFVVAFATGQRFAAAAPAPLATAQGEGAVGWWWPPLAAAAVVGLVLVCAPWLVQWVASQGAVEQCALWLAGFVVAVAWSAQGLLKALAAAVLGLLLGLVGHYPAGGVLRFTADLAGLPGGLGLLALAVGLFGGGEVMAQLARRQSAPAAAGLSALTPRAVPAHRPHSAMRSAAWCSLAALAPLVALLVLGIPAHAGLALLMGFMAQHGVQPGAGLATDASLAGAAVAAAAVGAVLCVLLQAVTRRVQRSGFATQAAALPRWIAALPLRPIAYQWVYPAVLLLGALGSFAVYGTGVSIAVVAACAVLGYGLRQLDIGAAPLVLGFVMGPGLEERLVAALAAAEGNWSVFASNPVSAGLLAAAVALFVVLPALRARRVAAGA